MTTEYETQIQQLAELQRLLNEMYLHREGSVDPDEGYVEVRFTNFLDQAVGRPLRIEKITIFSLAFGPLRFNDFYSVEEALTAVQEWHAKEMTDPHD